MKLINKHLFCLTLLVYASVCRSQTAFVHYASASNIQQNWTYIDHAALNNNPKALLQVTPQYAEEQHQVGIWYETSSRRWAIFNQSRAAIKPGTAYHVVLTEGFVHQAGAENISGNFTILDHPQLNGNPQALVFITPHYSYHGQGNVYNDHSTGVFYNGEKWAIFNQDMVTMPTGAAFNISFQPKATQQARVFKTGQSGFSGVIPGSMATRSAVLMVSQNWNPGGQPGVYNNGVIQIGNEPDTGEWHIYTNRNSPATGAAFNVAIFKITDVPDLCQSSPNLGFEDGLRCWTASGTAFSNQPVNGNPVFSERVLGSMALANAGIGGDYWKGMPYPVGFKGQHWIGTYEKGSGDAPQGTLTSTAFSTDKRYIHFLLGGGKDINRLYVELQVRKIDYEAAWGNGKRGFFGDTEDGFTRVNRMTPLLNSEELFRYFFDLDDLLNHQFQNKIYRLVIADNSSADWGHVNTDDFGFTDDISGFISFVRSGFRLYTDPDRSVWGFADTHAHPTHQEGFGKKLIVGHTDGPMQEAFASRLCHQNHSDLGAGATNNLFIANADEHIMSGWPDFVGFPRFTSKTHQQQHISWIKRAYDGGLRLVCALGVNNTFIATRSLGLGNNGQAVDDESVIFRQLDLFKRIAASNSSWMEIAYTPADARRIILSGKLAVVLGVEMDNFGNFKDDQYVWNDDRGRDRPLIVLNESNAPTLISQKLDEYYQYGIRQVTSLHYINGVFGGTAVFRGEPQLAGWAFRNRTNITEGISKGVGFNLYEDFNAGAAFLGSALSYGTYAGHIHQQPAGSGEVSQVNADGLTPAGRLLMKSLMQKGFLVDLEHMSYRSIDDLFSVARPYGYPVMSSHTDPQELSFISNPIRRFNGTDEEKYRDFRTSTIRFVRHEGQIREENIRRIAGTGGVVGPIMLPYRKTDYRGSAGTIVNNCDGSSRTWAQMYLYCLDRMGGKGVALSTDRGMVDFIGPRFGVQAAYSLKEEKLEWLKKQFRTSQRYAQVNGVKYDRPYTSYHPDLFSKGDIEEYEADAWRALAAWEAGINPWLDESRIAESSDVCCRGRIRNYAKGLFATNTSQLLRPGAFTGDAPWEQAAMYALRQNSDPNMFSGVFSETDINQHIWRVYNQVRPAYFCWIRMKGNNEPLRRLTDGNRDWDINLDGVAHYGMLPDFLQDLKNIGLTALQLMPLFRSAEDYIQMWEKAERVKASVR